MATFDEVLRELRGGVQVATRWKGQMCIKCDRVGVTHLRYITKDGQVGIWAPPQSDLFAEDWVIYANEAVWLYVDWS